MDQSPVIAGNSADLTGAPTDTPGRGPLLLGVVLIMVGVLLLAFGSVTIVPFLPDESYRMPIRHSWLELSRDLPQFGPSGLARLVFWFLVLAVAGLSAAVILLAGLVTDSDDANDPLA